MADNFTQDQIQGLFGEFKPVLDEAGGMFSANLVQGVFGEFRVVLDETSGGTVRDIIQIGIIPFVR